MTVVIAFTALLIGVLVFYIGVRWGSVQDGGKAPFKMEFSKVILLFETVLVGYVSHRVLNFVEMAISANYTGSLPYLTTFISAVWAAYGASVSFYQNKSAKENVKKIEAGAVNRTPDC